MIIKALIFGIMLGGASIVVNGDIDMVNRGNDITLADINAPVVVYVDGTISESSAIQFARDMKEAHKTGQPIIPVVIRSYGGSVYSLLSMIDTIKSSKVPVATIVVGKAMSAGAALLTCGTDGMRWAAPNSTIMIHEVSSVMGGKVGDIKADADEVTRLNDMMFGIMSENIGKKKNYLRDIIHSKGHADWYLTPIDAAKHGIINHIGFPEFETTITVKTILR